MIIVHVKRKNVNAMETAKPAGRIMSNPRGNARLPAKKGKGQIEGHCRIVQLEGRWTK